MFRDPRDVDYDAATTGTQILTQMLPGPTVLLTENEAEFLYDLGKISITLFAARGELEGVVKLPDGHFLIPGPRVVMLPCRIVLVARGLDRPRVHYRGPKPPDLERKLATCRHPRDLPRVLIAGSQLGRHARSDAS